MRRLIEVNNICYYVFMFCAYKFYMGSFFERKKYKNQRINKCIFIFLYILLSFLPNLGLIRNIIIMSLLAGICGSWMYQGKIGKIFFHGMLWEVMGCLCEYVILFMEGIIRIAIFLGYIVLISRMEDIKRVFMYHGAEHKTINCLEAGVPLTPENVDNFSRLHKRCGTSFIFIVMIISMVFFFFIRVDTIWLRIVLRLLFLPLVAGVSYEFIRLAGSSDHPLVQIFSKPGLALQKLTTKEPDHSMIEVAIASVEGVFDWREYLKEEFGWKPEENEEKNADI